MIAAHHLDESAEWVAERIDSWVETYKKAMLTPIVLALVARSQPTVISDLTEDITALTGWQITERGLYRTVRRLQDSGLLSSTSGDAPRTGAKRKVISLTALGEQLLDGVQQNLVSLPRTEPRSAEPEGSRS